MSDRVHTIKGFVDMCLMRIKAASNKDTLQTLVHKEMHDRSVADGVTVVLWRLLSLAH